MLLNLKRYCKNLLSLPMKIGTHDGRFHCDEVMACTLLRNYTKQFKNATIIRTRDPKVLEECDIVVDVGGKYNPPYILDHHQIEFQDCYPNYSVRLSSAGLVYLHYAKEIIPNIIDSILQKEKDKLSFEPKVTEEIKTQIIEKIYKNLIIFIDANDNGVDKIENKEVAGVPTTLWSRVAKLNPMWWEESGSQQEFEQFKKAMELTNEEIYSEVRSHLLGSLQTKSIVKEAFDKRRQIHQSGKIVLLEKYVPWVKPIFELEEQEAKLKGDEVKGQVLYVVFPEKSGKKWRIQAVPAEEGSFGLRKGLKEEWRGIKDIPKLVELSGIKDIDFCHASGFIGGAVSRESAIKMGELSI